jgi:corrinoid protein of di/trimethylamine methyltransferase
MRQLYDAILAGDLARAVDLTQAGLDGGMDAQQLVTAHMIPAMDEVGRRFENGQFFVPEMLIAARAMKGALELIRPRLAASGVEPAGRVVIGTVQGDLHDIGKGLVASMLEGGGFEVIDLGVDVPAARFVAQVQAARAHILALSALLTTTMTAMPAVIAAVREAGLAGQCKVMVGGAPVTRQFADSIGADGYSSHAAGAVSLARQFMAASYDA